MPKLAMLIDLTRCIGCDACTVACKQENGTPADVFFARVLNIEAGKYPDTKRVYLPMLCYHCENPACLKACPNKAIFKRADGVVLIDQDRCRGTGACVSACPYGNIILRSEDHWYLKNEAYEEDFVKPRLNPGVARKCTYCVHRVDEGLDPACVVACPTKARIFGDLEDENSPISTYIAEQVEETGRSPFPLLPEAGTRPSGMYLGTMAEQGSSSLGRRAGIEKAEPLEDQGMPQLAEPPEPERPKALAFWKRHARGVATGLLLAAALGLAAISRAQEPAKEIPAKTDVFSTSSCMGCHGMGAMGGLGPPIAQTKLTEKEFEEIVRKGKGMMPATRAQEMSDEQVSQVYEEVKAKPWDERQIPIAYKVGQFLATRNVGMLFLAVTAFALFFGVKVWLYWVRLSAPKQLWPAALNFGLARSAWVFLASLVVDGFLVASLWRTNKFRWLMHGLILYGFCGLMAGDALMQIFNPLRMELPFFSALKLLPIVSGAAAISGVFYVMYRYRKDPYIDNGMTQGRDFLFLNLLLHTLLSGFLTVAMKRAGITGWVMPIYLYHLTSVLLLLATAPFTRFMHAWIVPTMIALGRLASEISKSGVDLGFEREPAPGRHHKSQRVAEGLIESLEPDFTGPVKLRYYP
jgi:molybdopterin-containing oxidoreductase family iron-sulfur binding subunit